MVKGRRWRMRVSMGALASAALLTTLLIEPASAAPEACSYDAGTRTVTATIASGGQATLLVVGGELHFGATPTACGAATTTNTDSLVVNGEAGTNETLVLDHRGGPFGPGFTQEFNTGEIEMTFAFGDSTDKLIIYGTDGDDHMAAGQSGIALNSDGDVDITITPAAFLLEAHMLLGADFFNGGGEGGAGLHFLGSITLHGGPGSDTGLRGGEGPDFVYGGDGNDAINTHDGIDVLDGGPGNDTLQSGSGDDSLTGGSGLDTFTAAAGNDVMYAQDDEADTQLHGGQGTDTAHVDSGVDPRPVATETVIGDGGPPPPPSGSCTYNATTKAVTASIPAGQQGTLIVVGGALHFGSTPAACGAATTTNTDSIAVSGGSGTIETLVLDLSGGAYAPGAAAEADTPEIELTTALGDATDVVIVRGGPGNDTLRIGTTGMALNADGDRDVTLSPHPAQVELIGGGGVNTLSANGGFGTGSTYLGKAILRAGDAGDLVTGGNGNDELYGGLGNDTLEGRNGHDLLLGSGGNDVLRGGDGDDDMTGGSGADDFSGSSGNDTMRADDDAADTGLNGGAGIDTAYVDVGLDPPAYGTENVISA